MSTYHRLKQLFGLEPYRDFDLIHEPSADVTRLRPADTSPRTGSPGEDGPTAPVPPLPGAVGHPNDWDAMREGIERVRLALIDVLIWLDELDPTPARLASVAEVTDLDAHRT